MTFKGSLQKLMLNPIVVGLFDASYFGRGGGG